MRNAIASILTALAVAGCESSAGPNLSTLLGYRVDAERNRSIWLTRDGVQIHGAGAQPKRVALPGWLYAGAPYCPPDLALGPKGEVVVTSNVVQTLWRIDPETLAVTVHPLALGADADKDVGFAALVYSPEEAVFVAYSDVQRSVWRIDAALKGGTRVAQADLRADRRARGGRLAPCAHLARRLADFGANP